MVLKSCFPELPGGGCWPRDARAGYRGCFPGHELGPSRQDRAPSNTHLLLAVANVSKEVAVVRLGAHALRAKAGAARGGVARSRNAGR